jgi:hypothetical protein
LYLRFLHIAVVGVLRTPTNRPALRSSVPPVKAVPSVFSVPS